MEKPHFDGIDQVFAKLELSGAEREALLVYRKLIEYRLLRAKPDEVSSPSFIGAPYLAPLFRCIAGFVRFLDSPAVVAPGSSGEMPGRRSFIKEMFSDEPVHCVMGTRPRSSSGSKGEGMRIRAKSTIFWDKLQELMVLSLACAAGQIVSLPSARSSSKQPEFWINNELGVEVKNLAPESVDDLFFGPWDSIPHDTGPTARDLRKLVGKVESQFASAAAKFSPQEPGLVLIRVPLFSYCLPRPILEAMESAQDESVSATVLIYDDVAKVLPGSRNVDKTLRALDAGPLKLNMLSSPQALYMGIDEAGLWPAPTP